LEAKRLQTFPDDFVIQGVQIEIDGHRACMTCKEIPAVITL
jgi:hypothetical protein